MSQLPLEALVPAESIMAMDRRCASFGAMLSPPRAAKSNNNATATTLPPDGDDPRDLAVHMYRLSEERFVRADHSLSQTERALGQMAARVAAAGDACGMLGGLGFHVAEVEAVVRRVIDLANSKEGEEEDGAREGSAAAVAELWALVGVHFVAIRAIREKLMAALGVGVGSGAWEGWKGEGEAGGPGKRSAWALGGAPDVGRIGRMETPLRAQRYQTGAQSDDDDDGDDSISAARSIAGSSDTLAVVDGPGGDGEEVRRQRARGPRIRPDGDDDDDEMRALREQLHRTHAALAAARDEADALKREQTRRADSGDARRQRDDDDKMRKREAAVTRKEAALHDKEKSIALREEGIAQREDSVDMREEEIFEREENARRARDHGIQHDQDVVALRKAVDEKAVLLDKAKSAAAVAPIEAQKMVADIRREAEAKASQMEDAFRAQRARLDKDLEASRSKIAHLTHEMDGLRKEHIATAAKCRHLEVECHSFNAECQRLKAEAQKATADVRRLADERARLAKEVDMLVEKCTALDDAHAARLAELERALDSQTASAVAAQTNLRRAQDRARAHFDEVQDLRGNLRVMCRIRPVLQRRRRCDDGYDGASSSGSDGSDDSDDDPDADVVVSAAPGPDSDHLQVISLPARYSGGTQTAHHAPPSEESFEMERVFDGSDSAATIFAEVGQLVASAVHGKSACIFAYGQTGAGKTHTMTYPWSEPSSDSAAAAAAAPTTAADGPCAPEDEGIVPRAVRLVGDRVAELRAAGDWSFVVVGSFVEVYAEHVHDLLNGGCVVDVRYVREPEEPLTDTVRRDRASSASSSPARNHYRPQALEVPLTTPDGVFDVGGMRAMLAAAARTRRTRATALNARSSRSHTMLTLRIAGTRHDARTGAPLRRTSGVLNLVDLAGSEKCQTLAPASLSSSPASPALKEGIDINRSLSTLRAVLAQLADPACRRTSMRESILTRILEPSLAADGCKTLMLVMVSPLRRDLEETRNTLRFAVSARQARLRCVGDSFSQAASSTTPAAAARAGTSPSRASSPPDKLKKKTLPGSATVSPHAPRRIVVHHKSSAPRP
jgi:kinesin family protein C1